MKAIVTGANGFIGAYLVNKLLDEGIEVLAISRKFDNNIIMQSEKLEKIELDVSNIEQLESKINYGEYELFYHLAWNGLSGEARSDETIQINNALMTVACLKTASKIGCKKFICAGSIMEFETMHITYEEVSNSELTNCYGASKMLAHTMCKSIANSLGIELVWGYITNAYGIGEISLRFINTTLTKILNKEDLNFTSATQNYDFVYVTDIAKAFYLMGLYGKNNKCYMIGSGNAKPLKGFILDICKMFPESKEPKFGNVPFKGINLPLDVYSIKELKNDCKFKCDVTFEKGIQMTMDWLGGGYTISQFETKESPLEGTSIMVLNQGGNSVSQIEIEHTDFDGLYIIHPHIYNDFRGMYKKIFHKNSFDSYGIPTIYSETSDIVSKKGSIRGLHYQTIDSQAKLVHAIRGRIYDVALDLRPSSKTFGKCFEILLDAKDNLALFIPKGFAHGFLSLDDDTIFSYQCTGQYHPESCGGILWNDKKLGINWPIEMVDDILITEKDKSWPTFDEYCIKERVKVCKEF